MDRLPEDVLAMVMSLLSVQDVFSCRLVCKRLSGVALNRDVWQHRGVRNRRVIGERQSNLDKLGCPVLRLAPCLRELEVSVPSARCHEPFAATCAVRKLKLTVRTGGAVQAALLIRQLEALGRLRTVICQVVGDRHGFTEDERAVLLGTLASTSGLERLLLYTDTSSKRGPVIRATVAPSLKSFTCSLTTGTEAFCNFMLAAHGATLEAVGLETPYKYPRSPAAVPASLLAAMPNLRRLTSRLLPGLEGVAACKSLREVKFIVDRDFEVHWIGKRTEYNGTSGAGELLRRADQLRSVHLVFPRKYGAACEEDDYDLIGSVLIDALATRRLTQLDELTIEIFGGMHNMADLQHHLLFGTLPSLPALRRLSVKMCSDILLEDITPAIAPSLRSLRLQVYWISGYDTAGKMCAHAVLHSYGLRELFLNNPLLHVEIEYDVCTYDPDTSYEGDSYSEEDYDCKVSECGSCLRHKDLKNIIRTRTNQRYLGVFAHAEALCPSPEYHATNIHWMHIDKV